MKKIILSIVIVLCVLSSLSCTTKGWSEVYLNGSGFGGTFKPEYKEFEIDNMPCVAVVWGGGLGVTCDWSAK